MQARGLLMIEHRLIERMIAVIQRNVEEAEQIGVIDPLFVDKAVDFIKVYADRTHHGKEEEIMFKDLQKKTLSEQDRRIMNELIEEHVRGRETTNALVDANTRYRNGDGMALAEIVSLLRKIVGFYPGHIEKEDKVFFPAARKYLSDQEDQAMLSAFHEFDRMMIHESYKNSVEKLENA